uniref:EB domain-containing protein n=1 Tax=Romanomermis culicivorax TaxID=13658 RepID=A0A915HXZ4_ROMCU
MKIKLCFLFLMSFTTFSSNADDSSYDFLSGLGGPLVRGTLILDNIQDMFQAGIGSFCNQTSMCKSAYAHCVNQTCVCKNDFTKSASGKCIPNSYFCPEFSGGTPKSLPKSGLKTCYVSSQSSLTFGCSKENVTEDFCFLHPRSRSNGNYSIGHCCPKPKIDSKIVISLCPLAYQPTPSLPCSGCATTFETCISMKHWTSRTSFTYMYAGSPVNLKHIVYGMPV